MPLSSPRDTNGADGRSDLPERLDGILAACNSRGVGGWSDDDEVVVHHVETLHAATLGDEFFFRCLIVHKQHVAVAVGRVFDRLSGADRDDAHVNPRLGGELRQEMLEESGVLGRGRRLQNDERIFCLRRGRQRNEREKYQCGEVFETLHDSLPGLASAVVVG